jgi:hypothetical protein
MQRLIQSSHKTYNKQVNGPNGYWGRGNVASNTQYSSYVRGFHTTTSNGHRFEKGELMTRDLDKFQGLLKSFGRQRVAQRLAHMPQGILYVFFHTARGERFIHGWMLTDEHHQFVEDQVMSGRMQSFSVLKEMRNAICTKNAHETFKALREAQEREKLQA